MANINLETKDYVLLSLDTTFSNDDVQCVCQRLGIHRGKYWANPYLGSRLYTLSNLRTSAEMFYWLNNMQKKRLKI